MADLYIRWSKSNPKDIGDRPIVPCWPPNAVWTNASIWMSYPMSHPDPAKRGMTAWAAAVDEEVFINVEVYSRAGTFPFPPDQVYTRCQIWACTGANGVGPISALASCNGATGLEGIVLGDVDVPDTYGVASVLWTPTAADNLAFDANGAAHVCLAANLVYPASSTATPHGQGQSLPQFMSGGQPVQTVFPCGDGPNDPRSNVPIGHFQGQRNIQVMSTAADANLIAEIQVFGRGPRQLTLAQRTGRAVLDAALREHLLAHPLIEMAGGRERRQRTRKLTSEMIELLAPDFGERLLQAGPLPLEPRERARLAGGGRLVLADDPKIRLQPARHPLEEVAIEGPGDDRGDAIEVVPRGKRPERVAVDLRAAEADPPGTVRVFDLVERNGDGALVGGTTFITVAARG
jgi:hypothetical protein